MNQRVRKPQGAAWEPKGRGDPGPGVHREGGPEAKATEISDRRENAEGGNTQRYFNSGEPVAGEDPWPSRPFHSIHRPSPLHKTQAFCFCFCFFFSFFSFLFSSNLYFWLFPSNIKHQQQQKRKPKRVKNKKERKKKSSRKRFFSLPPTMRICTPRDHSRFTECNIQSTIYNKTVYTINRILFIFVKRPVDKFLSAYLQGLWTPRGPARNLLHTLARALSLSLSFFLSFSKTVFCF